MSGRHIIVWPYLPQDFGGARLVHGIGVGVQKVNDNGFAPHRLERRGGVVEFFFDQRRDDAPGRVDPFRDFQTEFARNDGLELTEHAVGLRSGAASHLDDVAESFSRDHASFGQLTLKHRVRRRRRPVDDGIDRREVGFCFAQCLENAKRLILRGRWRL